MRVVTCEVRQTPVLNQWQKWHWQKRRRYCAYLAWEVRAALGRPDPEPIEACTLYVDRYSSQLPDWDGLYGGLKPLLDTLVVATKKNPHGLGVIRDDNPHVILRLVAMPYIAPPGQGKTVVSIHEVEA